MLKELQKKSKLRVVGLMSGTSVDAVSVAICNFAGRSAKAKFNLESHYEHPIPSRFKRQIRGAGSLSVRDIAELNADLGELFADAALAAIRRAKLRPHNIDLIGSHGQTIYHHSRIKGARRATLQIADGDVIAARSGIVTVSDFRQRDIAHEGEGAPLTPYTDWVMFRPEVKSKTRFVLNLGGVANITRLSASPSNIVGFDTGPANGPLDRLTRILTNGRLDYDRDAKLARSGRILGEVLHALLKADKYRLKPAPKSTGPEMYGDVFVSRAIEIAGGASNDLLATLVEFSAELVASGIIGLLNDRSQKNVELIVAGGGAKNPLLLERIGAKLPKILIRASDDLGVPVQTREAAAFAVLGHHAIYEIPASYPSITGTRFPTTLGKISLPR